MSTNRKGIILITLGCIAMHVASYSDQCGKPGGPCNPGYDSQFGSAISKDNACPDDQPCEEGYFCIADTLNVGMPEYESNYCVKQPDPCGGYLQRCCAPEFLCEGQGPSGEPLTCQASGGPYFTPGSGLCMPNPMCGAEGQPCCQPWGHRDFWKKKESAEGKFGNPSLCNESYYCNFHTPNKQTPINGTCVPNHPECGALGKPCCIETTTTYEARDNSRQRFSCKDNLDCSLGSLTCQEKLNTSITELSRLCGQPFGACAPAYNIYDPNATFVTEDGFPDVNCSKACPENYLCSIVAWNDWNSMIDKRVNLSACIGPVDSECGVLGKPCCPWTIDNRTVDGDLHCNQQDSEGNALQCRSLFALNQPTIGSPYSRYELDDARYTGAINDSVCTKLVECGSENTSCCHDYQKNYIYTNPKSPHAAGNESLLCDEGLFCHYDNFTLINPQGICIANDPTCGLYEGSPCCTRSLTIPVFERLGINIGKEEEYCRNESLICARGPPNSVLQFGFSPICLLP